MEQVHQHRSNFNRTATCTIYTQQNVTSVSYNKIAIKFFWIK